MTTGARHILGVIAGLVLTPVLAGVLLYGVYKLQLGRVEFARTTDSWGSDGYIGLGLLAVTGVLIAVLASSRISPLAALITGLTFAGTGALWAAAPKEALDKTVGKLPDDFDKGYALIGPSGVFLLIGMLLLTSLLFPSRWRSTRPSAERQAYEYGIPGAPGPGETPADPDAGRHARDPFTSPYDSPSPYESQPQSPYESPTPHLMGGESGAPPTAGTTHEFVQPPSQGYGGDQPTSMDPFRRP